MTSIADTRQELVHLVLPEHANILGTLFGGRMMYWIVSAATLATLRLARSSVVLGSMDHLDFLGPVRVGDLVILQSQVEYVGRASMEVGVEVETENPRTGERRRATSAHLGMVAVDETGCPKPVGTVIDPAGAAEEAAVVEAQHRKQERMKRIADRRTHAADVEADLDLRYAIEASRIVFPEDAAAGNMMFAGTLLLQLDEFASIVAVRYARGAVVTASLDALDFYAPIFVGNIVTHKAAINYVGRTSMEVGIRVMAEDPITTAIRHTCTAYLTTVHIGSDHLPAPVPPFAPETPGEHRRWQEAEARRALRERRGSL